MRSLSVQDRTEPCVDASRDSPHVLRGFTLQLDGTARESRQHTRFWMPRVGLGVTLWHGAFERSVETWLRWCDRRGNILLTGVERDARTAAALDLSENLRRAEHQRAEKYARMLRELGVDVD